MYIGGLYFTRGIQQLLDSKEMSYEKLYDSINRHIHHDFGDTDPHDIMINNRNLNHNCGTVHSSYGIDGYVIWVITSIGDADTTYTTVLLPEEY